MIPNRFDPQGKDRQTYEQPNCGSTRPHDQHFHSPIGGLTLNCPGVAGKPEDASISRAQIAEILDDWYERYNRAGRMGKRNEDMFLALRNRLLPIAPGAPVQFRKFTQQRWLNGTFEGPVDNPEDPNRLGDVIVIRDRHSPAATGRVPVFLSSVRRRP